MLLTKQISKIFVSIIRFSMLYILLFSHYKYLFHSDSEWQSFCTIICEELPLTFRINEIGTYSKVVMIQ
jgi:hypothetical protein